MSKAIIIDQTPSTPLETLRTLPVLQIDDIDIQFVEVARDLGHMLNLTLSWKDQMVP